MAPKGTPRSQRPSEDWRRDFGEGGLWEPAKQGLLGLGPWMGQRIQMPRAGKVPKKNYSEPQSGTRTARSALSAWQGSGLLKLAALKLGEAEEAALQLLR